MLEAIQSCDNYGRTRWSGTFGLWSLADFLDTGQARAEKGYSGLIVDSRGVCKSIAERLLGLRPEDTAAHDRSIFTTT